MTTEFPGPGPTGNIGRLVIRTSKPGALPGITVTHRSLEESFAELHLRGLSLRSVTWAPGAGIESARVALADGLNHYLDGDVSELQRLTTEAEG